MQKTVWMMLLILSLPTSHPARAGAVDELAQTLATKLRVESEKRRARA
jgi:hypothetical protein